MKSSYYTPGKLFGVTQTPKPQQVVPVNKAIVKNPTPTLIKAIPLDLSTNKSDSAQLKPMTQINQEQYKPTLNPHGTYGTGGFVQQAMDAVLTIPYGIAGFNKGQIEGRKQLFKEKNIPYEAPVTSLINKRARLPDWHEFSTIMGSGLKNIIPGIINRTQFSSAPGDSNATKDVFGSDNKIVQEVGNFGLNLATPTIPFGKVANVVSKVGSKIPGVANAVTKTVEAISKVSKETPAIYKTIETFNPFYRNKQVGEILDKGTQLAQKRIGELKTLIKETSNGLTAEQQIAVGKVLEGGKTKDAVIQAVVNKVRPVIQQVGKEAEEMGYLSKETIEKFKNGYMPHTFENSFTTFTKNAKSLTSRITGTFFKKRKDKEGYIKQYAPAVFKGIGTEIKDIVSGGAYKEIAEKFGTKVGRGNAENAYKLIDNKKIARIFRGMKLPNEIVDYINRADKVNKATAYDTALGWWKAAKTIYNPAYHIRNLISNQILSNMSTGKSLPSTLKNYVKDLAIYRNKKDPFVSAAHDIGLIKKENFYDSLDEILKSAGLGAPTSAFGKLRSIGTNINEKVRGFQQITEDTSKLSTFKTWVGKLADKAGVSVEQALKDPQILKIAKNETERAIFSPYRISSAERNLVGRTVPFYSFARQAAPFTLRTLWNNPGAVTKYDRAKTAVEALSSDQGVNQTDRPGNVEGNIRLPAIDEKGAQTYFDPTYLYPWGNFNNVAPTKGQLPFGLSLNPFINEGMQQLFQKDLYSNQDIGKSPVPEEAIMDRAQHIQRTFQPTVVGTIQDKIIPAIQEKTDYLGRTRSKIQALIDTIGIKTQKITPQGLRSKADSATNATLRSIQAEEKNVQNDKSIDEATRVKKLQRLREIRQQAINP